MYRTIIFAAFLLWCVRLQAQSSVEETLYTIRLNDQLYNGREYVFQFQNAVGSQGYGDLGFVDNGTILFGNVIFRNVPLMYDIVADEVITRHPDRLMNLVLVKQFIRHFTIGDNRFVYLDENHTGLKSGFYHEIYYSNNLCSYEKRAKIVKDFATGTTREKRFVESVYFYIKRKEDSDFIEVKSQNVLLNLFGEKKKELRILLRENDLTFKQNPLKTISTVLAYVDNAN
ncbi:hypothetical protein [Olivibacter sitiensis]|uniref:hypothetical protein n=1 Tax=Olivibacter sitiensis TaxID=376470 RepID=UPI00048A19E4|nr:hypothetical protein [Olivibacter sitiensis]